MRVGTALKSLLRLSNTGVLSPPETHARFLRCLHGSCACLAHAEGKQKVVVIAMPKLSPTMTEGSLLGWLKDTGDQVEPYDLLFELETESLTEEAYRVGDFEGKVGMQIECVEDAFLAKHLVSPGSQSLAVGTPIGILCEDAEDIEEVAKHQLPAGLNEYNSEDKHSYRFATWQSYLKERKVDPTGSCM